MKTVHAWKGLQFLPAFQVPRGHLDIEPYMDENDDRQPTVFLLFIFFIFDGISGFWTAPIVCSFVIRVTKGEKVPADGRMWHAITGKLLLDFTWLNCALKLTTRAITLANVQGKFLHRNLTCLDVEHL